MTEIAYMVREDWGQHGTGMERQSALIREWLRGPPLLIATADLKKYNDEYSADREFLAYTLEDSRPSNVTTFPELAELTHAGDAVNGCVVALHPYKDEHCKVLRRIIARGRLARVFVIVRAPRDTVRIMLDGMGAVDLHAGKIKPAPDPVMLEAAKCMVGEQYNGLASGNGKAAVVQLIRAFAAERYPIDAGPWLRAFFAASGEFDEAEKIAALIAEMKKGVRHRAKDRYRPDIVSVLRERAI